MVPGLLAVLIAGHIVGSVDGGPGRGYPAFDRDYYGGSVYAPYGGCGRGYSDCGGYGYRRYEYGYPGYSYRGYDDRYRDYGYDYGD
jgi:hypothetical protein